MEPTLELKAKLDEVTEELKAVVDASIALRQAGRRAEVAQVWEGFLGDFLRYVVSRGRETGENLLAGLSFPSLRRW